MKLPIDQKALHVLAFLCMILSTINSWSWEKRYCNSNANPWIPEWQPERDNLLCSRYCDKYRTPLPGPKYEFETLDACCVCHSCTAWEGQEINLFIEYISVSGKSLVLTDKPFAETETYKIQHTDGEMSEIPSNICQWDRTTRIRNNTGYQDIFPFQENIVTIDFRNNKIRQIPDMNCLTKLDSINLADNRITYLSNTSFANLTFLRHIDISYNRIVRMDPQVVLQPSLRLQFADLSHNKLKEADFTNGISMYRFCFFDYSHNIIDTVLNELDLVLNVSTKYGAGVTSLVGNVFKTWPNFKEILNLEKLSDLQVIITGGFDFRGIKINCDCNLEPFMNLTNDLKAYFWISYHEVKCYNPPELKGIYIIDVPLEKLVCHLTAESSCPRGCTCIDRPKFNILDIDCTNINLREMPKEVPVSKFSEFISLNVSSNYITSIGNVSYLSKLTVLDISNNILEKIDEEIAKSLENATLDLSNNNRLRRLPKVFQYRSLCKTSLQNITLDCDCEARWIESWYMAKKCNKTNNNKDEQFKCEVPENGSVPVSEFKKEMLEDYCGADTFLTLALLISLSGLTLLLIIFGLLVYKFRYEILILWLRAKQESKGKPKPEYKWDVALTLNEDDDDLRAWVKKLLLEDLMDKGYKVFFPCIDVPFGSERDLCIIETFPRACNFILVLSESYLEEDLDEDGQIKERRWTENEWKYAWHQYLKDRKKNIIIINYGYVSPRKVEHPQIKAYLRVGHVVQFCNHDNDILQKIIKKLGPPGVIKPKAQVTEGKKGKPDTSDEKPLGNTHGGLTETPKQENDYKYRLLRGPFVTKMVNTFEKEGTLTRVFENQRLRANQ